MLFLKVIILPFKAIHQFLDLLLEYFLTFIKSIRIKKDNYYIANSEIIGDVFEDNDEVFC